VAVASALRERDRQQRALARLVLAVLLASGLVLAFGGVALRQQRKELTLTRELAVADLQRQGDEALARSHRIATLGTFAMGIAHEISTPLGVIAGRAEQLAARTGGDERAARAVQAIADEAERIRRVVRGFLALARSDTPDLGSAAPEAILKSAVAMVEHRFASAGVAVDVDVAPGLAALHCDRTMLEQAVVNLLLNACDASRPGDRVAARVDVVDRATDPRSRSVDGERVAFTVRDEGAGISPEAAARATEPFFTTKPEGQGTGLGLAITSEIVKLHHGELTLAPGSPRGTVASIVVPLRGAIRDAA
jgi:signal transduction histidine kinase